ncbi:MAG: DUF4199 domain-containing protein [Chitinophagaceae bacterium]
MVPSRAFLQKINQPFFKKLINMEEKVTTPIVKGIVITLIMIVYGLVVYFMGEAMNQSLSSIQYVILLVGIIWSCISYSKQMKANVTFGNVFAHGFKTAMVVTALTCVYTLLSLLFLFPDMVDKGLQIARQKMQEQGNLTDEQMQSGLDIAKRFFVPFAVGGILIMFAIVGAISSLLGAAFAKKQPQDPFGHQIQM